jgi:hypothetical protein
MVRSVRWRLQAWANARVRARDVHRDTDLAQTVVRQGVLGRELGHRLRPHLLVQRLALEGDFRWDGPGHVGISWVKAQCSANILPSIVTFDSDPPEQVAGAWVPDADKDVVMGFKRITPENFMLLDLSRAFGLETHAHWIGWFNEVAIDASVPEPVRRLFELARGSMIYAWLYYPLVSVGFEQCGRCLEAGLRYAAVPLLGWPAPDDQTKRSYRSLIESMIMNGHLPKADESQWMAALDLRNDAAHPKRPTIWAPGHARGKFAMTAERLNALFARVAALDNNAG